MKQWYALRSKSKREFAAASLLTQAGIEVYLPQVRARQQHAKPPGVSPFFPGYLFARLDPLLAEIRLANYTSGISYVVGYGGEPWPVPDDLIFFLQRGMADGRNQGSDEEFRPGDRIVVTSGPLRGIEGVFDHNLSTTGRVRILVHVLNRLCPTNIPVRQVRRSTQAASAASS
jgi:transcriptional antiterminator RfaH